MCEQQNLAITFGGKMRFASTVRGATDVQIVADEDRFNKCRSADTSYKEETCCRSAESPRGGMCFRIGQWNEENWGPLTYSWEMRLRDTVRGAANVQVFASSLEGQVEKCRSADGRYQEDACR